MRRLDLRLIVLTDAALAAPADVDDVVRLALTAGAPAIQLRDKDATVSALTDHARALLPIVHGAGARLFINDRIDVALASGADGVHLGPHDIPVAAARRMAPAGFLIGYSTDDPEVARKAQDDGASYIGCGAVFGTTTKRDLGDERIGLDRFQLVANAVDIPVVAIGGITARNAALVRAAGAAGVAVAGAIMAAADPAEATRGLLA